MRADLTHRRHASTTSTVVGWESFIVLRDVRGLGPDEIEEVSAWMATALLTAALAEG